MTRKTVSNVWKWSVTFTAPPIPPPMLQTRQNVFWIVPKWPIQTWCCPDGLVLPLDQKRMCNVALQKNYENNQRSPILLNLFSTSETEWLLRPNKGCVCPLVGLSVTAGRSGRCVETSHKEAVTNLFRLLHTKLEVQVLIIVTFSFISYLEWNDSFSYYWPPRISGQGGK